ncbi:putative cytochrome P450 4d21 [Botryosphaeria dothidea]|uniref:Cytochrome P450 4d21 n=1 Tax=Botryosphaeria dothidea TaxID=55169 RepID=A0A8H4II65_9PEZI|nr:putative cytochrome P450 4d21 [Botryosphaeria dothidea]
MSIPAHTIQRDPRYFEDPDEFYPERWSALSTETAPFLAFSRVLRGWNSVLLSRRFALGFDLRLADDGTPAFFEKNQRDTFTLTLPPLNAVFETRTPGQRE